MKTPVQQLHTFAMTEFRKYIHPDKPSTYEGNLKAEALRPVLKQIEHMIAAEEAFAEKCFDAGFTSYPFGDFTRFFKQFKQDGYE